MQDRRIHPRMLCADLIDVWWTDHTGRTRQAVANLEDISSTGAFLQMEEPIPSEITLHICHPQVEFSGRVRYCVYRDTGYFIGLEFEEGFEWDERLFRPQHMLDPRSLIGLEPPRPKLVPQTTKIQ